MRPLAELKRFAREAARIVAREKDLASFEIYCASAEHRIARLNYTSDIPCRGVEEFKSLHADGFQLRIVMRRDPHEVGAAFEAGDFSADAVRDALRRARSAASSIRTSPAFRLRRAAASSRRPQKSDLAESGTARSPRRRGTCSGARSPHLQSAPARSRGYSSTRV